MVFDLHWEVAGDVQLGRRFTDLERSFDDFSEPLTEAMGVVEEENEHQFQSEGDPGWPELSDQYAARKRRIWGDKPIMEASRALRRSLTDRSAAGAIAEVTPTMMRRGTGLEVGTKRKWNLGLVHQKPKRKGAKERPTMRLRKRAQQRITRIFHDWFGRHGEGL